MLYNPVLYEIFYTEHECVIIIKKIEMIYDKNIINNKKLVTNSLSHNEYLRTLSWDK